MGTCYLGGNFLLMAWQPLQMQFTIISLRYFSFFLPFFFVIDHISSGSEMNQIKPTANGRQCFSLLHLGILESQGVRAFSGSLVL